MSSHAALTSSERSRCYWTATMERYFIDLMLDHLHRGNRIGYTFNKQAWTEMLTVFNSRFVSQYDKDSLKFRYTNLWNQFNDIKKILRHNGFSWDETLQMIVAHDSVWDAYLQAHPNAHTYKNKVVLNLDDLCLIYGFTSVDGRYSRSSHDIDVDDEISGMSMGDEMVNLSFSGTEHSKTDWNPAMDQYFVELMLDQLGRGNCIDRTFNKHAWTDMLTLFNAKFGPQHGKRVLRHRYRKIRKYYTDVKKLLTEDGFLWDETLQMIVASDDVWGAYIKAHPYARSYRTKTLPNYKDLSLIYGDAANSETDVQSEKCNKGIAENILGSNDVEGKESRATRTYWTPPMDRYFIELLLDQVKRGNKVGQTFITKAWIDMTASFNVRFASHYDKYILKNRYKHLKKQHNDMTDLIGQSGFSWDEAREMVVAEDNTWDAYIKEHPDARSYRVKTVSTYPKLCVIFGLASYGGKYDSLACNVDCAGELPVLMTDMCDVGYNELPYTFRAHGIEWEPEMDNYFTDLMLSEVDKGNKPNGIFNDQAWAQMLFSMNARFGNLYDRNILENRYVCLLKEYTDITNLLSRNGFIWDESQQIITASSDLWDAYIEEHPGADLYRNKILQRYNNLCLVFASESLLTEFNYNSIDVDIDIEFDHNALQMDPTDEISLALQSPTMDNPIFDQSKKRRSITPPLPSASPGKVQRINEECTLPVKKNVGNQYIVIEKAIDALQAIQDMDDELLLDACDLMEDETKAKSFLALDTSPRKKWLMRKLRQL